MKMGIKREVNVKTLRFKQWGIYFIPKNCLNGKKCNFMLNLHGCNGLAEHHSEMTGAFAAANDVVMVYPQAIECWDTFEAYTGKDYMSKRTGMQMLFMKKLWEQVAKPLDANFNYG